MTSKKKAGRKQRSSKKPQNTSSKKTGRTAAPASQSTLVQESPPAHSTSLPLRMQRLVQMQHTHGNRYVQQELEPSQVQRDNGNEEEAGESPTDRIQDFVENSAEEWRIAKDNFDRGLRRFRTTMTMTSEDEAVPDVTGALVKHVVDEVTGAAFDRLETLVPGWSQAKGALDAMVSELERADTAGQEVALRDFLLDVDDIMSRGFTEQIRAIRDGRQELYDMYNGLASEEMKQSTLDSLPNWLAAIRARVPSAEEFAANLFIEWVKRSRGQLDGWTSQGIIYIKYDAQTPGSYDLQSAEVATPFANKVASGLNWMMSTESLGMPNVLALPLRKHIGLYCENLVGGTSYDWGFLDEDNNTVREPLGRVGRRRWRAMPWAPIEAVTRLSGNGD